MLPARFPSLASPIAARLEVQPKTSSLDAKSELQVFEVSVVEDPWKEGSWERSVAMLLQTAQHRCDAL